MRFASLDCSKREWHQLQVYLTSTCELLPGERVADWKLHFELPFDERLGHVDLAIVHIEGSDVDLTDNYNHQTLCEWLATDLGLLRDETTPKMQAMDANAAFACSASAGRRRKW